MNKTKWICLGLGLTMVAACGVLLMNFKHNRKLSAPGVLTRPIPGVKDPVVVEVVLPEKVLDYDSVWRQQESIVTNTLPPDTSYGTRFYNAPDKFSIQSNVVLMGRDRTSHHKPQYCLTGSGWNIDESVSRREIIAMDRPVAYDLPVMKLIATRQVTYEGRTETLRGVYVYWFVSDNEISGDASGFERMWSMGRELVKTGVLHRWAYVTFFAVCQPGQEDATYERMKKFIVAATPEFQLVPSSKSEVAATPGPAKN